MDYYSAIKDEVLSFVTKLTELEGCILHEISHAQENKYSIVLLICES